jgi:hypothetical protein
MLIVRLHREQKRMDDNGELGIYSQCTYMEATTKFTVVTHLDVNPLIQTETNQVEGLLNCSHGSTLQTIKALKRI